MKNIIKTYLLLFFINIKSIYASVDILYELENNIQNPNPHQVINLDESGPNNVVDGNFYEDDDECNEYYNFFVNTNFLVNTDYNFPVNTVERVETPIEINTNKDTKVTYSVIKSKSFEFLESKKNRCRGKVVNNIKRLKKIESEINESKPGTIEEKIQKGIEEGKILSKNLTIYNLERKQKESLEELLKEEGKAEKFLREYETVKKLLTQYETVKELSKEYEEATKEYEEATKLLEKYEEPKNKRRQYQVEANQDMEKYTKEQIYTKNKTIKKFLSIVGIVDKKKSDWSTIKVKNQRKKNQRKKYQN